MFVVKVKSVDALKIGSPSLVLIEEITYLLGYINAASNLTLSTNNQAVTLVYTNATKGWQKQSTNS